MPLRIVQFGTGPGSVLACLPLIQFPAPANSPLESLKAGDVRKDEKNQGYFEYVASLQLSEVYMLNHGVTLGSRGREYK